MVTANGQHSWPTMRALLLTHIQKVPGNQSTGSQVLHAIWSCDTCPAGFFLHVKRLRFDNEKYLRAYRHKRLTGTYAVPLSLLLLIGIHDIDTNRIWRTVLLMPVFHVLPGLHRNGAATVVFLVKSWIEVMHDRSEVALQRIVVDRALTVAI